MLRLLRVLCIVSVLPAAPWLPGQLWGQDGPLTYIDHVYSFSFQFPKNWKMQKVPAAGDAGEVRVYVKHPTNPMYVVALVGLLRNSVDRQQFLRNTQRDMLVATMIEFTVEQVYQKTSKHIGAERMVVADQRPLPSTGGIRFYIATAHFKKGDPIIVAGFYVIPFGKPYMVTLLMFAPADKTATQDNAEVTRVFNSFHVEGESPVQ